MSKQKKTLTAPFDGLERGLILDISFDEFICPKLKLIPEPGDTSEDRVQAQVDFLHASRHLMA